MKLLTIVLDFVSVFIQLIGTGIMFFNSPINELGKTSYGGKDKEVSRKNKFLKMGFLILAIGFIIQIIDMILKTTI